MSSKLQIADNVYTIDNYSDKQVQINGFRRFSKNNDFYNNKNKHDLVSISIENEKITKPSTKPKFSFKRLQVMFHITICSDNKQKSKKF